MYDFLWQSLFINFLNARTRELTPSLVVLILFIIIIIIIIIFFLAREEGIGGRLRALPSPAQNKRYIHLLQLAVT